MTDTPATRAAIYARMSTDKQSADSPADQIARCREYAEREGLEVVLIEQDAGVSGASRHNRPRLLSLFAEIDAWDVCSWCGTPRAWLATAKTWAGSATACAPIASAGSKSPQVLT